MGPRSLRVVLGVGAVEVVAGEAGVGGVEAVVAVESDSQYTISDSTVLRALKTNSRVAHSPPLLALAFRLAALDSLSAAAFASAFAAALAAAAFPLVPPPPPPVPVPASTIVDALLLRDISLSSTSISSSLEAAAANKPPNWFAPNFRRHALLPLSSYSARVTTHDVYAGVRANARAEVYASVIGLEEG